MFKLVNHIEATRGSQEKHLKFPIAKHPKGPCKHHIVVRVDRGADVNCMNGKTFNELFPEDSENLSENREESQIVEPLCTDGTTLENAPDAQNAQCTPYTPWTHKSTCENFRKPAKIFSDFHV